MNFTIPTLDDLPKTCEKVLLRLDINSPIDPATGRILDSTRFKAHKQTLLELLEMRKAIVILAHQGRPAQEDFISLENHAKVL